MNAKKGFTLIELLAVIIILAIIALIAIPITLNVINNSKKRAFQNTAYGLIDAAKLQYSENFLNGNIENLIYTFPEAEGLKYSGEKPKGGTLRFTQNGDISIAIYNDEWCATKGVNEEKVRIEKYQAGKCIIPEEKDIPIITLLGEKTITLSGNSYVEPGYSVKTIGEETIPNDQVQITILGQTSGLTEIDINTPDTYIITYTVNYKGTQSSATRTVIVEEIVIIEEPTITPTTSPNSNGWYNKDININITTSNKTRTIQEQKYCITTDTECVPFITLTEENPAIITTESKTNYVCALTKDQAGHESDPICSGPYQLDKTGPDLTVPADVTVIPSQATTYNLLTGASANDTLSEMDGSITTSGNLSTIEKTYIITYTARDKAGNSTSKTRNITVKTPGKTFTEIMNTSSEVMNNDPGKNKRYVGTDPNNYVKFNNELWRIIGVFDGQVKIIRNEPYSTKIAWSTNKKNDWSQATLQTELNTTFLNSINATSKSYIDTTHIWILGGASNSTSEWTRAKIYSSERGSTIPSTMTENTWQGAIGLMYPSDYGYATSSTNSICNTETMYNWHSNSSNNGNVTAYLECAEKSWLYNNSYNLLTITPHGTNTGLAFIVYSTGRVNYISVTGTNAVRPVLYLKSTVKITGGSGTSTKPYTLGT